MAEWLSGLLYLSPCLGGFECLRVLESFFLCGMQFVAPLLERQIHRSFCQRCRKISRSCAIQGCTVRWCHDFSDALPLRLAGVGGFLYTFQMVGHIQFICTRLVMIVPPCLQGNLAQIQPGSALCRAGAGPHPPCAGEGHGGRGGSSCTCRGS